MSPGEPWANDMLGFQIWVSGLQGVFTTAGDPPFRFGLSDGAGVRWMAKQLFRAPETQLFGSWLSRPE